MMPIAMILGVILHNQVGIVAFIIPYLIFAMLLLTYSRLSLRDIRFTKMHGLLISIQVLGSVAVYLLLAPFNKILAQGVMITVLAPTATSAPVITHMLKGNIASLTAYSLISNLAVAVLAPVWFSIIGSQEDLPFMVSVIEIGKKVFVLLVLPFVLALLMRKYTPKASGFLQQHTGISFYLWSVALVIVSGKIVYFLLNQPNPNWGVNIAIAVGTFVVCGLQFYFGRKIGRKYDDTVAGGQGLGQKNTVLSIWMTQMYLNPVASLGPGAYVLWQNVVNSYQVWRMRKHL